jgi:hypothetical protein
MGVTKSFRNTKSIMILYNAYVRSKFEYCSTVWNPHYGIYIDLIERFQRKFTRMMIFRSGLPYENYSTRLTRITMFTLELRRLVADELTLYKIVNGQLVTSLMHRLSFANPRFNSCTATTFYLPSVSTNVEFYSRILRLQRSHDRTFHEANIHSLSYNNFRRAVCNIALIS